MYYYCSITVMIDIHYYVFLCIIDLCSNCSRAFRGGYCSGALGQ